jgi:hypothetical protein
MMIPTAHWELIMSSSILRLFVLTLPVAALSACGGSSTSLSEASFEQLDSRGDEIADRFMDARETAIDDMPRSGSASYSGVAAYGMGSVGDLVSGGEEATLASAMTLNADFRTGEIHGAFTGFKSSLEGYEDTTGRINIRNGGIVDNVFAAELDGQIAGGDAQVVVAGEMYGAFLDRRAQGVAGGMEMVFTDEIKETSNEVSGVFIGEQD